MGDTTPDWAKVLLSQITVLAARVEQVESLQSPTGRGRAGSSNSTAPATRSEKRLEQHTQYVQALLIFFFIFKKQKNIYI
jgi:hypothetical protein